MLIQHFKLFNIHYLKIYFKNNSSERLNILYGISKTLSRQLTKGFRRKYT